MLVNCPHCNISFDAPEKKKIDINSECDFCEITAEYEGWYSGEVKGGITLKNVCTFHLRYLNGGVQIGESGLTQRAVDEGYCTEAQHEILRNDFGNDVCPVCKTRLRN